MEEALKAGLRKTDILVLPYKGGLQSTIDMPMLLLEGMASLCAVITRPYGDIPSIYGESDFLLTGNGNLAEVADLFNGISLKLDKERRRLFEQNRRLNFEATNTAQRFKLFLEAAVIQP